MKDLTGKVFGKLTAIRATSRRQNELVVWECQCSCGRLALVNSNRLQVGAVKSCGCLNRRPLDWTPSTCTVPKCPNKHKGHGYCVKHLARWKARGTTDPKPKPLCSVEGCLKPSRSKGLCNMHRIRLKLQGTPGEAAPRKGLGGTGTVHSKTGYRYFYRPRHPNASKRGFVAEHIIVMAQVLGRPLKKGETIHHRNGIRADNRIENLELRTGMHPAGQSIQDMLTFCRAYLKEYENLSKSVFQPPPVLRG